MVATPEGLSRAKCARCGGGSGCRRSAKIPSSRETPSIQAPKESTAAVVWLLEFLWCLDVGAWSFRLWHEPLDRHLGFSIPGMEGNVLSGGFADEQDAAVLRGALCNHRNQLQ